jgi:hypothetical protein
MAWEVYGVQLFNVWSLFYCGKARELARRVPNLVREARQRGDLYNVTNLSTSVGNMAWLVVDRPDDARRAVDDAMSDWSPRAFHLQHYWALLARTHVDLYQGDAEAALARIVEQWPAVKRSLLLRMPFTRMEVTALRARAYLAAAAHGNTAKRLREAVRAADWLEGVGADWTTASAQLLRAGIAVAREDADGAVTLLATAEESLTSIGMILHAMAARRRRGLLLGGGDGTALVGSADAWMRGEAIQRPDLITNVLVP